MSSGLMPAEASRLAELELVVERGLATFVDVGLALLEIRDERYYRASHATFEAYCRERWSMGRAYANRTIQAAEVAGVLAPIGAIPANEAQARELVTLLDEPELMREAWAEASANGEPTAAAVRGAVGRRRPVKDVGPIEDVAVFHADTERVCPTCHGTGWIPLDEGGAA